MGEYKQVSGYGHKVLILRTIISIYEELHWLINWFVWIGAKPDRIITGEEGFAEHLLEFHNTIK